MRFRDFELVNGTRKALAHRYHSHSLTGESSNTSKACEPNTYTSDDDESKTHLESSNFKAEGPEQRINHREKSHIGGPVDAQLTVS
jgi:hypothetical protein